ncbi:hypothetical protein DFJ74DRAFT_678517 [Hyaloraphidium curvatum]|nr:hypothetical protein DFJ74DRAFT_678517 [Hyaloraphidium curvatum]
MSTPQPSAEQPPAAPPAAASADAPLFVSPAAGPAAPASPRAGAKHRLPPQPSPQKLGRRGGVAKRNKRGHADAPPIDVAAGPSGDGQPDAQNNSAASPCSPPLPITPLGALDIADMLPATATLVFPAPADLPPAALPARSASLAAAPQNSANAGIGFQQALDEDLVTGPQNSLAQAPSLPSSPSRKASAASLLSRSASASPKRSLPVSAAQSPSNSRPGTPTNNGNSGSGFFQSLLDAASRMVGAKPAQADRRDLPPLPSAFHEDLVPAQAPPQVPPTKLIISSGKNSVAPLATPTSPKKLELVMPVPAPALPPQLTIVSDAVLDGGAHMDTAVDAHAILPTGDSHPMTHSPTSEAFSPGDDDKLSPARASERQRRRRRTPGPRTPISPPPPDTELDTPTRVRTSMEELESKLDGEAEGVQEPGVEVAVSPQDGVVLRWQSGDDLFLLSSEEQDESALPPLPSPLPPLTTPIVWTVRQQQGYRKPPGHPLNVPTVARQPLHQKCEDVHHPPLPYEATHSDAATGVHPINHNAYHLFVLADGHGGHGAAEWFVPRIRDRVEELLRREDWEFSVEGHRCKFGEAITAIFAELDREYCDIKIAEFEAWKRDCSGLMSTVGIGSGTLSATDLAKRPADDGCTLVVNLIYRFHLLNCNVGDSRTVLARRWVPPIQELHEQGSQDSLGSASESEDEAIDEVAGDAAPSDPIAPPVRTASQVPQAARTSGFNWTIHFASKDHSPDHPHRAHHIHRAGGLFINDDGTRRAVRIQPPHERGDMIYTELTGSRIYRPPNDAVKALGISHLKTLNLAGTMGDLLFKITPAVISSRPDITFVRIRDALEEGKPENGGWEHLIVYTTDGVWDHLRQQNGPSLQNKAVIGFISGWVDRILAYGPGVVGAGERGGPMRCTRGDRSASADAPPEELGRAMGLVAGMMCEREAEYEPAMTDCDGNFQNTPGSMGPHGRNPGLYYPFVGRFDDITVGMCYVPVGGMTAASQGGSWRGKEEKVRNMASQMDMRID